MDWRCWQHPSPAANASSIWTNHDAQDAAVVVGDRDARGAGRLSGGDHLGGRPGPGVRGARRRSDRSAWCDVLSGIVLVPARIHRYDYRRPAFGDAWTDDTDAPGGHNDCDTRDDILNRDLVDKTYVWIKRCPKAVETGTLHDPYTNASITFHRGAGI